MDNQIPDSSSEPTLVIPGRQSQPPFSEASSRPTVMMDSGSLESAPPPPVESPAPPTMLSDLAAEAPPPPPLVSTPPPPKDNNRTLIIIVIVVLMLCCCCCAAAGAIWLWNNGDQFMREISVLPWGMLPLA